VAVDGADTDYVVDHNNYRIRVFDASGKFTSAFGVSGDAGHSSEFAFPVGITVDASGGVYVADSGHVKMFGFQNAYVPTSI
jgi:hypothetical protein